MQTARDSPKWQAWMNLPDTILTRSPSFSKASLYYVFIFFFSAPYLVYWYYGQISALLILQNTCLL